MTLGSLCYIQPERHRIAYKTEYEVMKMVGTMTHLGLSFLQLFINSSLLDSLTNFLLLYVYSTAILREHLLLVNGSHIRSWWIFHHFICIAISGTTLIWPYGSAYVSMRRVLVCFNVYMAAVQIMQYRYQTARLYTLRALSQVDPMETTSDAGHLHLTTGLVLLLPFLFLGHVSLFMFKVCLDSFV